MMKSTEARNEKSQRTPPASHPRRKRLETLAHQPLAALYIYPSDLSAAAAVESAMEECALRVDVVQHRPRVVGHGCREDDGVVVSRQRFQERVQARSLVHLYTGTIKQQT